jgi:GNAT superfamily N-acetyltransferase
VPLESGSRPRTVSRYVPCVVRVDLPLIKRLERSLASVERKVVEAYRRDGGDPATARPLGDGVLIAQGPGRFVNRAIGVSLDEGVADKLNVIDDFFAAAGVPAAAEVSSWAPASFAVALSERGYRPEWFGEMFVAPTSRIASGDGNGGSITIEPVDVDLISTWQFVFATGFEYIGPTERASSDRHTIAVFATPGAHHYLALVDGALAGCGTVYLDGDIAWLGGAATVPDRRGGGVQRALLDHRIAIARDAGCPLTAVTALPSSGSARNVRTVGFTAAHTRLIMSRPDRAS